LKLVAISFNHNTTSLAGDADEHQKELHADCRSA
jgi:hypothetical protein